MNHNLSYLYILKPLSPEDGGGYGIHWEEIDEDISVEELLRGATAPDYEANITLKR